jgi:hypothetical protein
MNVTLPAIVSLMALCASTSSPAQSLPQTWNRATDWVPMQNPSPDSHGNLVWFSGHYFGSRGTTSQWDAAWHGWTMMHSSSYYNGADPVTSVALNDFTLYSLWRRYFFVNPMVDFRNTTNEPFLAAVEGTLDLHWAAWMSPEAPLTDAEVFVEHYDRGTGTWTTLAHFDVAKPTNSTIPEHVSIPLTTATVRMDHDDRIRIRLAAKFASATDSRLVLYDRDVTIVRKSLAEAREVERYASPRNPLTLERGRTNRPVLGTTWDPYISDSPTTGQVDLLALGLTKIHATTPFGILLTEPIAVVTAQPRASFQLPIPQDTALAGTVFSAQGASVTAAGGLSLANALDARIGDF